jgi:hypothetical protein
MHQPADGIVGGISLQGRRRAKRGHKQTSRNDTLVSQDRPAPNQLGQE